jgi:hypothetical protein
VRNELVQSLIAAELELKTAEAQRSEGKNGYSDEELKELSLNIENLQVRNC